MIKQGAVVEYTPHELRAVLLQNPAMFSTGEVRGFTEDRLNLTFKVVYNRCNVVDCRKKAKKVCRQCKLVPYCSVAHASADWGVHKAWCDDLVSGLREGRHMHRSGPTPGASGAAP
jgi:hypothetical protein